MQKKNYLVFMASDTLVSFAAGIFGPFWIVFIQKFSSTESLGFAVSLMVLGQSATSYLAGLVSDKFGRKIFMIGAKFALSMIIFSYTLISSVWQLYILQVLYGITVAIEGTAESAFLGDITEKSSRGKNLGKLNAITGFASAFALMGASALAGSLGFEIIFYGVAGFYLLSVALLFAVKE